MDTMRRARLYERSLRLPKDSVRREAVLDHMRESVIPGSLELRTLAKGAAASAEGGRSVFSPHG